MLGLAPWALRDMGTCEPAVSGALFCAAAGRPRGAGVLAALAQESQCFTFARGVATACVCVGILVYARGKAAAGAATKAVPAGVEAA
jgi:hypothetical protein